MKVALNGFLWQILYINVYMWNPEKNGRDGLVCKEEMETQTFVGGVGVNWEIGTDI